MTNLKNKKLDKEFDELGWMYVTKSKKEIIESFINKNYVSKGELEERIAILEFERKELFSLIKPNKEDCVFQFKFVSAGHRMRELQSLLQALNKEE